MNILEEIIAYKKIEVARQKNEVSIETLEKGAFFTRKSLSLESFLLDPDRASIIAEFKRRSPSKGIINENSDIVEVTRGYTRGGASGLSVLTDSKFFGGSNADLIAARAQEIPILRKDFVIDEYQIVEARSIGADVILLIAACLTAAEVKALARTAKNLQLEVLLEIHDERELDHICDEVDLVGVNNRDLKTFTVDLEQSVRLAKQIGSDKLKVAESGISKIENVAYLKNYGFDGFLIGEHFMKQEDPVASFAAFVEGMRRN